jgi:hypothetical protein
MPLGLTFSAGNRVTGAQLQAMVNQIDSLTAPTWTSYTPAFTGSTTNPTIGNGTITGRWRRAANSDLIQVEGRFTFGSTSTIGSGTLAMSLPHNATATDLAIQKPGPAEVWDVSTTRFNASCALVTASTINFYSHVGVVTHTFIGTWAVGDSIIWSIDYEPV